MVHKATIVTFICAMIVVTYQRGTFFEQMTDESQQGQPMEEFHQCSMKDDCNFITQDKKTKKFRRIKDEKDLPRNRDLYNMWQKRKEDENNETQTSGKPHQLFKDLLPTLIRSVPKSNYWTIRSTECLRMNPYRVFQKKTKPNNNSKS